MSPDLAEALRRECGEMAQFCRGLSAQEWAAASAAPGWRVQDVVAHVGGAFHSLFTPASLKLLTSKDIERTNDEFVDARRDWAPADVLAEYERWQARLLRLAGPLIRTPVGGLPVPLGELGRFPLRLVLGGALVFDQHVHLRHDMAPVLGRPVPGTDEVRMSTVLAWMFAVLGNQLRGRPGLAGPATGDQPARPRRRRLAGRGGRRGHPGPRDGHGDPGERLGAGLPGLGHHAILLARARRGDRRGRGVRRPVPGRDERRLAAPSSRAAPAMAADHRRTYARRVPHHDLIVLGAGSGNMVVDDSFGDLDVAIVEPGPFGGTCLNRGCIPSKMLAHTAVVVDTVADAGRFDVRLDARPELDWPALRERVFSRLDEDAEGGRQGREDTSWITVYRDAARFTGPRTLRVGDRELTADQVVIAVGGRPVVPPPVTGSGLPYETSDTVMRVDAPPRRLAVLGGGYIAAELAQVFSAAGSGIVLIEAAPALLGPQDETVSAEFTELAGKRWDLRLGRTAQEVSGEPGALRLGLDDGSEVEADLLLVAIGRAPNSDALDVDAAGVEVDDGGRVVVDRYQRTTADGVWALGDVCTPVPLKHVANREAEVVRHNLRHPDDLREAGHDLVPAAVFTDPQVASVGATEQALRENGMDYRVGLARYADTAYGWAMAEPPGFCKVLAEPGPAGRVLGAHIMGPQAPSLIQPLVLAMTLDIDARTLLGRPYWIHPAMTEVVQQALVDLAS